MGFCCIQSSTIKSDDLLKKEQRGKDSDSFSLEIRDEDLKRKKICLLSVIRDVGGKASFAEAVERFET